MPAPSPDKWPDNNGSLGQRGVDDGCRARRHIEIEGSAGLKVETLERASERLLAGRQSKAVIAGCARENE